jgi:hypothetical protein
MSSARVVNQNEVEKNRPDLFGTRISPNGRGGFMKKSLLVLVTVAFSVVLMCGARAFAATTGTAEISLRCTTTISVSLVAGSTYFAFGDLAAATTAYSTTPIIFRNDSVGAICRWDLNVDVTSLNGWTLGTQPGLDKPAIAAVFKKSAQPLDTDFDMSVDSLSVDAKQYNASTYYDTDYNTDGPGGTDGSKILPKAYADSIGASADRKLWLKIKTPLAVSDSNSRTLRLQVVASPAGV